MPARSEAQQRLMGMALSAKRGKGHYGGKVKEIANSMTLKQLHDFAATKHEGLSEKKAGVSLMDPSMLRLIGPLLAGGLIGPVVAGELGGYTPDNFLAGQAGGLALGGAVGMPWGLSHLKTRSVAAHKDKKTSKADRDELEHHYPELAKKAFVEGFVKRASEYGFNQDEAVELLKQSESSWLGRYLAAETVPSSILQNKAVILNQLDPEAKRENLFLTPDEYRKQRELAYGHVRNTLKRSTAGSAGKNFLLGGALGGLLGAGQGAVLGNLHDHPLGGAAIGALTGGLTLGSLSALDHVYGQMKERKITDEDIEKMKQHQKDDSFNSEFIPFKNMFDAYKAGKTIKQQ